MSELQSKLLVFAGSVFVALGVLGIFLPILPTTPFLLLAAACYARGSRKFYDWLLNQKHLGDYVRNYREGRGIPLPTKILTLILLWAAIGYSVVFAVASLYVRIVLLLIAVGVTAHILTFPTLRR